MDCLRCPVCSIAYTDSQKQLCLPRVLILCGHTFCQQCIERHLENEQIICFQCQKVSSASNALSFPINQTLIAMLKSTKSPQEDLCKTHNKKLQAYCEKQKQLICVECTLTTHRFHKALLISVKAQSDRTALKESLQKIIESYNDSKRTVEKLSSDEAYIESSFLDFSMEVGIFYKQIIETITALQQRQIERLKRQKDEILKKIQFYKDEALERQAFHEQLQEFYSQLSEVSDIEFLRREIQQSFLLNNCKAKKDNHIIPPLEFKRVSCLEQIMKNLEEMANFEKKKIKHSNSVYVPKKDSSILHGSPSLKKASREPAVLEVNLSEQYNKRKIIQTKDTKKIKPKNKTINISSINEKQKIIEALTSGRCQNVFPKQGKVTDLKFIRESSIKKNKDTQSLFFDELEMSQNFTPMSVNSFMRTSRDSQMSMGQLNQSSIKHSFNQFSLLEIEEKVYHFGGRAQSTIEKYSKQSNKSQKISLIINRKALQSVYHRSYSHQKCLILGGVANSTSQIDNWVYEFNFKTEKIAKTPFTLTHPRSGFGCISKDQSIYIVGGKQQRPLNTFQKLDFVSNRLEITKMPNMVQAREDLGFCLGFDGFIYVAGGVNHSNNILNSCQRYNWDKKSWESVPLMKHQRRGFTLIAVPHGIFAIGGHSTSQVLKDVEIFDFNRRQWIELSPMNEARCFHSAVISKDYQTLTVFGGFMDKKQLDSIQIYEIENNRWISGGKMRDKRCLHTSILSPL